MPRERDVRTAIRDALVASGAFGDAVWLTGTPEESGTVPADTVAVAIAPISTHLTTGWDDGPTGGLLYNATVLVTIIVREIDIQLRDELADGCVQYLKNAVNGQSLGGMTLPAMTRVNFWKWLPPTPPERRVAVTVSYAYIEEGWAVGDTAD